MKKLILTFIAIILTSIMSGAQEQPATTSKPSSSILTSYYTFSWNTAFTIGDFNKWVGNGSPAGFVVGGRYLLHHGLTIGYDFAWQRISQIYYEQTFTVPEKGIAVNADNYRSTWLFPFQGVVAYHFITERIVSPYISLGIGGDYMEHHLLVQEFDFYKYRWDFSLTPELGALIKFGYYGDWAGVIAVNYKWTTNQITLYNDRIFKDLQMVNLKLGVAYLIH